MGVEMLESGQVKTKKYAVEITEMNYSKFKHRLQGQRKLS